jgi:hypothetical protein
VNSEVDLLSCDQNFNCPGTRHVSSRPYGERCYLAAATGGSSMSERVRRCRAANDRERRGGHIHRPCITAD